MKIQKSRIRSAKKYLSGIEEGANFYIGLKELKGFRTVLVQVGLRNELKVGDNFLPIPVGKISKYNAVGKFKIRRDKPKETRYRDADIKDWRGNHHSVSIPYKAYPRDFVPAPKINLEVQDDNDEMILTSPLLENTNQNRENIKHIINLFLEIFGECFVLHVNLVPAFNTIKKLSWNILPQGEYPWERLESRVTSVIDSYKKTDVNKTIIKNRIKTISDRKPSFVAIGESGFRGYMIFGFSSKNVYILESIHSGNATYVFGEDWEILSQMTKAQIIKGNKQLNRIIHNSSWQKKLNKYIL